MAVLLLTREDNAKVRHSIAQTAGGSGYDFYVLAHEEPGAEMDFGAVAKLSYDRGSFSELGFQIEEDYALDHCADLRFCFVHDRLPDYDWYVFVGADVLIRPAKPGYFQRLAAKLSEQPQLDLVAVKLGFSDPKWMWHAAAARTYEPVLTLSIPLVALSGRALSVLLAERRREQARAEQAGGAKARPTADPDNLMFCEAFVPSALWAARLRMANLNDLLPGSYADDSFASGPPQPMHRVSMEGPPCLAHPVVADRDALRMRAAEAWASGDLDGLHADLALPSWPAEDAEVAAFRERLGAKLLPPRSAPGRVAVLLRTHLDSLKVRHSIAELAQGSNYDFYMLAHEEPGREMDFGAVPKVSHSMQALRELGFNVHHRYFMMHFADVLFGFVQQRLPDYDWYVMVENDVFIRPGVGYFDRLAARLAEEPEGGLDMAAGRLAFSNPHWMWHAAAARVHDPVLGCFFPIVAVSRRAVPFLLEQRLQEQAWARAEGLTAKETNEPRNLMFCEAFIGSALWAGGFRITDLNCLIPGSYDYATYNTGPPMLLNEQTSHLGPALLHPVLDGRDFLDKHFFFSLKTGGLPDFLDKLRWRAWPLPDELQEEYAQRTAAELGLAPLETL
ncbi:MAG: hypothetical protein M3M95_04675 [Pseudomonadota bacterium]|nr:hypothetical protein [Pseudomonadota bacterium]